MPSQQSLCTDGEEIAPRAFGSFTVLVAENIGVPLRSIAGYAQLLEEKCRRDDETLQYLDAIRESSRTAQARLAALMQYAQLDAVVPEEVDCRIIINHALAQLERTIEEREALIRIGALPVVIADGERMGLLFYALLDNALKFCTRRPEIHVAAERRPGGWILSVRDNGIGIALEHHATIFGLFSRLHGERGIGLALAARIAELHGGALRVESRPCDGATFFLTLPDRRRANAT